MTDQEQQIVEQELDMLDDYIRIACKVGNPLDTIAASKQAAALSARLLRKLAAENLRLRAAVADLGGAL